MCAKRPIPLWVTTGRYRFHLRRVRKRADQQNIKLKIVNNSHQQASNLATRPTFHTTFSELLAQVDHNYRLNMSTLRYFLQIHSVLSLLWIRILNFGPIWIHIGISYGYFVKILPVWIRNHNTWCFVAQQNQFVAAELTKLLFCSRVRWCCTTVI